MARQERTTHNPAFIEQNTDFNDQLYRALRNSPWWMISIAAHVLLFVISGLIQTDAASTSRSAESVSTIDEPGGAAARGGRAADARGDRADPRVRRRREGADDQGRRALRPQRDGQRPPDRGVARRGRHLRRAVRGPGQQRPHRHRRRRGRRVQGPRRSPQPARGRRRQEGRRRGRGRAQVARGAPVAGRRLGVRGLPQVVRRQARVGRGPRRRGQGRLRRRRDGPRAARVPRRRATRTAPRARSARSSATACGTCATSQDAEGCFGSRAHRPLRLQPRDRRARDGRGVRHDGQPDLQEPDAEGARLHRDRAQPVLRVALRRQAGRQRHLGDRLDDDGAQEREAHQRGRRQGRASPPRCVSTRRPSTASRRGSTR